VRSEANPRTLAKSINGDSYHHQFIQARESTRPYRAIQRK